MQRKSFDMDSTSYVLKNGDDVKMSKTKLLINFVAMCVLFSINHGCVTACIALASSDLGSDLSAWSSGTLYLMYTLCALIGANAIVHVTGSKYGLASALLLYCAYIASFLVARETEGTTKWVGAVLGSVIGGFAAGYLWTAQGPFMQAAAKLYSPFVPKEDGEEELLPSSGGQDAKSQNVAMKKSNSLLAAIFGFTYLVSEALMKVASTYIPKHFSGGENTIYIVFTILSVLCAFGMLFVSDLTIVAGTATKNEDKSFRELLSVKTLAAIRLLTTDSKMILLYPVQMAFGIAGSFVAYYANGVLVKNCVNDDDTNYIGYFAALIAVVAGVMSPVFSIVTRKFLGGKKEYVMIFGIVAFLCEMAVYMAYDLNTDNLKRGEDLCDVKPLLVLYVVHGLGRGVWESTNKAVILDFFPNDAMAAFANVIVSSGLASTIGFFMYEFDSDLKNHPLVVTTITVVLCAISLITYPMAVYQNGRN